VLNFSSVPELNQSDRQNPNSILSSNCLTPLLLKAPSLLDPILSRNLIEQIETIFNHSKQNSQNLEDFLSDNLTTNGVNKWSQVITAFVSLIQACHSGQRRRDGGSYFDGHLVPVATIAVEVVKELLNNYHLDQHDDSDDVISLVLLAAIAHDFLEDTGSTPQRLAITLRSFQANQAHSSNSALTDDFLNSLITIITLVTKRPKEDYPQSETPKDTAFLVAGLILAMTKPSDLEVFKDKLKDLILLIPALIKLADNLQNCLSDLATYITKKEEDKEDIDLDYVKKRGPYYLLLAEEIEKKIGGASSLPRLYKELIERMFSLAGEDHTEWKESVQVQSTKTELLELVDRHTKDPARFSIWERYRSIFERLLIFKGLASLNDLFPNTLQYIKSQLLESLNEKVIDEQKRAPPSSLTPLGFIDTINYNLNELKTLSITYSVFYQKLISLVALLLAEGDKHVVAQLHVWINKLVAPLAKFTDLLIFLGKSVDFSVSDFSSYDNQLQSLPDLSAKTELLESLCKEEFQPKHKLMSSFTTCIISPEKNIISFAGPIGALQMVILNYTSATNQAQQNINIFIPPYVIKFFKWKLTKIIQLREEPLLSAAQKLIQGLISDRSKNQTITYSAFGHNQEVLAKLFMGKLKVTEEVARFELKAAVTTWEVNFPAGEIKVICRQKSSPTITIPEYLEKQVRREQMGTFGLGVELPLDLPQITVAGNINSGEIENFLSKQFIILGKAPIDPLRPDSGVVFFVLDPENNELIQIVTVPDYHENPLVLETSFSSTEEIQPSGLAEFLRELFDPKCPYLTKGAVLSLGQSGQEIIEIKVATPWFRLFVWLKSLLNLSFSYFA
jgi:hypothetical protein